MTIDVGYAHLTFDDGVELDFVDVPGHDRLIGNMLVGAGEIDAAMLVVAADDGPRPQTLEHLQLLDALGIRAGLAVVTKSTSWIESQGRPRSSRRSRSSSPQRVSPACRCSPPRRRPATGIDAVRIALRDVSRQLARGLSGSTASRSVSRSIGPSRSRAAAPS